MKKAGVIFKKELKDTLRDRRTLVVMILIPLLLFPVLMTLGTKLMVRQQRQAETKELKLALVLNSNAADFIREIGKTAKIKVISDISAKEIPEMIKTEQIDFGLVFSKDFDSRLAGDSPGTVHFYMKSSRETEITARRITALLKNFEKKILDRRLNKLNLSETIFQGLTIKKHDIVTAKEKIGEAIGGFLPYIFVIFCFTGAMYPAIDLAAGEKEHGTIETLLASPATRLEIVLGKFGVVFFAGIFSALISIFGLFIAIQNTSEIPQELLSTLMKIIDYRSILMTFSLLVPLCIFFAAILLSISIFAHSFKEAQNIMTPMNILVIIPVFIGILPGIKLDSLTALIPVLNVSLATKEIIMGKITPLLLGEVFLSLFLLAGLSLLFCAGWFKRENVIFRAG